MENIFDTTGTNGVSGATELERSLYGDKMEVSSEMFPTERSGLREAFKARQEDLQVGLAMPLERQQARHRQVVSAVREAGVDPETIGVPLYHALTDFELRAARGEAVDVEAQRRAFGEESRRQLLDTYGPARAERILSAVEKFVSSQPKLATLLATGGIGADPKIVGALADHVRRQDFL